MPRTLPTNGDTTGNGTGTVPPPEQPAWKVRQAKLAAQYVAAGGLAFLASYLRTLPDYIDDLTRDFGDDLYDRMLLDPQVAKSMRTLRLQIFADDLTLRPAVAKDDPVRGKDHEEAMRWVQFCERQLERLERPLEDLGFEMLLASMYGNKSAEITYKTVQNKGLDANAWTWKSLRTKSRRSLRFLVDSYASLIGYVGLVPGQGAPVLDTTIAATNREAMKHVLPPEKFLTLSWMPQDEDPRGTSLGRCVYNPWWWKLQMWAQYGKYLTQFATPSLVGITPEEAQALLPTDADGNVTGQPEMTPELALLNRLLAFQGGTVLAVPFGTKIDPLQVQGNGEAFRAAFELFDRQISEGLTGQSLATNQPKAGDGNRSTAEVHQDVMGLLPVYGKRLFCNAVRRQLLYRLLYVNAGPDAAERFTPYCSLAAAEQQDRGALLVSLSGAYKNGYLAPSQLEATDEWVGLPPRQAEEVKAAQAQQQAAANPQQPGDPNAPAGTPDPQKQGLIDDIMAHAGGDDAASFFDESKVHRGQPKNRGQFGPGGGGAAPAQKKSAAPDVHALISRIQSAGSKASAADKQALKAALGSLSVQELQAVRDRLGQAGTKRLGTDAARAQARQSAKDLLDRGGKLSLAEAETLAGHLSKLTVAQLHEIKKDYGLKASGKDKQALVAKLAARLAGKSGEQAANDKPQVKPATPKKLKNIDHLGYEEENMIGYKDRDALYVARADHASLVAKINKGAATNKEIATEQKLRGKIEALRKDAKTRLAAQKEQEAKDKAAVGSKAGQPITGDEIRKRMKNPAPAAAKSGEHEARYQEARRILDEHGKDVGDVQIHGMTKPERMKEIVVDGIKFRWPDSEAPTAAGTLSDIFQPGQERLPDKLWKATSAVVYTSQQNDKDAYWEKRYGIAGLRSSATGGDGQICVYTLLGRDSFAHESGHNLAYKVWGDTEPSRVNNTAYAKAQQTEKPVSDYAVRSKSAAEDFADACKMYSSSTSRQRLQADFPEKYAALKTLMGD